MKFIKKYIALRQHLKVYMARLQKIFYILLRYIQMTYNIVWFTK